jgi:hypothetical protein
MTDESFGDVPENETEQAILLAVPTKPLNLIEFELGEMLDEELTGVDIGIPFLDAETGELENPDDYVAQFGRQLTAREVMALQDILNEPLMAKFRLPLIISRELGSSATIEEYRIACELENVDPIL